MTIRPTLRQTVGEWPRLPQVAVLRMRTFWLALLPGIGIAALATGIPPDVLPNPWFTRMTPVRGADVLVWVLLSVTLGAVLATYAMSRRESARTAGRAMGGGALGVLAIGCPVCNKLVVLALGASGALTWFAPLQPLLGGLAVALSVFVLRTRLMALGSSCSVPDFGASPGGARAGDPT